MNGLSANNTLQQQQYNLPPSNDTRNIYNNPYIPPQQQQQQQTQQTQQQRTAHLFKALAASATGSNSLTHPYDFSNSSSSSNANNELQGSSSSEADNAFLTHNNGGYFYPYINPNSRYSCIIKYMLYIKKSLSIWSSDHEIGSITSIDRYFEKKV